MAGARVQSASKKVTEILGHRTYAGKTGKSRQDGAGERKVHELEIPVRSDNRRSGST